MSGHLDEYDPSGCPDSVHETHVLDDSDSACVFCGISTDWRSIEKPCPRGFGTSGTYDPANVPAEFSRRWSEFMIFWHKLHESEVCFSYEEWMAELCEYGRISK